jgi:hypothetical protein
MEYKYTNGEIMKIGDIFTDGIDDSRSDVRLLNRAKVLYVDKFVLVWFALNEHTAHTFSKEGMYESKTWMLTPKPKKVDISELTKDELKVYNNIDKLIQIKK